MAVERLAEGFPDEGAADEADADSEAPDEAEVPAEEARLLSDTVGRIPAGLVERSPEAIASLQEAAGRLDETPDVNELIGRLKDCKTKEETFLLIQVINEKVSALTDDPDPTTVHIINEHIRIYVPGGTLIMDKAFARKHLTEMAIRYAVETDNDYLWLLPGTGYAVVYELPALLDEDRNTSIMAMKMMRYCGDYFREYLLTPEHFRKQYELNLARPL